MQTSDLVVILYETFTLYRQIFTDGRALPADPNPTWLGYSVGKWDGDVLLVDTAGFKPASWRIIALNEVVRFSGAKPIDPKRSFG